MKKDKKYNKMLVVRLSEEEEKMADELRGSPNFINISRFVRASVRNLYKKRVIERR